MSREDWEVFDALKQERKEQRAKRREEFNPGPPWIKHSDSHYSFILNGSILQYWPGPKKWHYRGKTGHGDVVQFIKKRTSTKCGD